MSPDRKYNQRYNKPYEIPPAKNIHRRKNVGFRNLITTTFEEMIKIAKPNRKNVKRRETAQKSDFFNLNTYNPSDINVDSDSNTSLAAPVTQKTSQ